MSEERNRQEAAIQQKLAAMFAANSDNVSIPKIYIDMTGDIEAAAVLDELMFWTLPKKATGKTSLRVFKRGALGWRFGEKIGGTEKGLQKDRQIAQSPNL